MNDSSRIISFCTNEEINEKTLFMISENPEKLYMRVKNVNKKSQKKNKGCKISNGSWETNCTFQPVSTGVFCTVCTLSA